MLDRVIHGALSSRLLIVVLAMLVMAGGWFSYRQLPVDAFPDVSPNLVQVFTITEGLAPEEIEKYDPTRRLVTLIVFSVPMASLEPSFLTTGISLMFSRPNCRIT